MTTLFDLLGYEVQTVITQDGDDDYEDPKYITPPLKHQEPEEDEPETKRRSPLEKVMRVIELCNKAMFADNPITYGCCFNISEMEIRSLAVDGEKEMVKILMEFHANVFANVAIAPHLKTTANLECSTTLDIEDEKPTTDPPLTVKGGYTEDKIVRKNGKVVGVYRYLRWRENGKLKSKYLGSIPK